MQHTKSCMLDPVVRIDFGTVRMLGSSWTTQEIGRPTSISANLPMDDFKNFGYSLWVTQGLITTIAWRYPQFLGQT